METLERRTHCFSAHEVSCPYAVKPGKRKTHVVNDMNPQPNQNYTGSAVAQVFKDRGGWSTNLPATDKYAKTGKSKKNKYFSVATHNVRTLNDTYNKETDVWITHKVERMIAHCERRNIDIVAIQEHCLKTSDTPYAKGRDHLMNIKAYRRVCTDRGDIGLQAGDGPATDKLSGVGSGGKCSGAGAIICGAGAIICGAGAIICGAGAIICGAGAIICGAGANFCGAGAIICGAGAIICAAGANFCGAGANFCGAGAIICAAGANFCGAGAIICGAGAIICGAGAIICGAGANFCGAGAIICGAGANFCGAGANFCGAGAIICGAGAIICGAGAIICGAGAIICGAGFKCT
ncbi:hypothetical protein PO909_002509 [Leuciscus waleckii]